MNVLIRLFKAVANEKRVKIIEALMEREKIALVPLAALLKLPYKTVARNLKILEKAMLVKSQSYRGNVYYSLETSSKLFYGKAILDLIKKHRVLRKRKKIKE